MKDASDSTAKPAYLKELFSNQIWQSANFAAKAVFLVALTPLMLARWGAEQYGLFALASSLLVSMALLDGGVRNLTRLKLVEAMKAGDDEAYRRNFAEGILTFGSVVAIAVGALAVAAGTGALERWLNLPPNGGSVLVVTALLTGIMLLTLFGLEPLAARNELSSLKAANTWGALVAIPVVGLAVWFGGSVFVAVVLYSVCLIVPNLVCMAKEGLYALAPWKYLPMFGPRVAIRTLREGVWYYLTTVALIFKTHALTFVVSAMAGPAEAGIFYILLRLTEIVGNVGSTASETSLAAIAAAPTAAERGRNFRQSWLYVALFSLHASLVIVFLGRHALDFWLADKFSLANDTMLTIAAFGLAGALSRVIVNASMGLGVVRGAAIGNVAEAVVDVSLAAVGFWLAGLPGLFVGGSVGIVCLLPQAVRITRFCDRGIMGTYFAPVVRLMPGLLAAGGILAISAMTPWIAAWAVAVAGAGLILGLQLRGLHSAR